MANLSLVLAVIVAGLAVVYLALRARINRGIARLDPAAEIREELGSVMVELNRTTDRNIALLEDRIGQLTRLLAEADRKIVLLRREGEKQETSRMVYTRLAKVQPGQLKPKEAPAPPPAAEETLEAKVLRLDREGFSPGVIANRVGSTVGEVELIVSLSHRRP